MTPASIILKPSDLKTNSFFEGIAEKQIADLLDVSTIHSFAAGDYVLKENDKSRGLFVILYGKIRIGKILYAGDEKELGILGPGEFFGEMAFLDDSPRSASASCIEECTILRIEREAFDKLATRRPAIAYKVFNKISCTLAKRLRASNELVEGIFSNPNRSIVEMKTRLMKIQTMLLRR